MKKGLLAFIVVVVIMAICYGFSILLVGFGLWALCKLGVIAAWTWKQAALWAIVLSIVGSFFKTTSKKD
jgi:hypothetical protein